MGIKELRTTVNGLLPKEGKSVDIPTGRVFTQQHLLTMRAELQQQGFIASIGGSGNSTFLRVKYPKHEPQQQRNPSRRAYATS